MPKAIRNVYDDAISFEKLLKAHKKARRGKREKVKIEECTKHLKRCTKNLWE